MTTPIRVVYDKKTRGLGSIDGIAEVDTSTFEVRDALKNMAGKAVTAMLPQSSSVDEIIDMLPNVFEHAGTCTSKCAVSIDGGSNWRVLTLSPGHLSMRDISKLINKQCASWWCDAREPGFSLQEDTKTGRACIHIDNTKCMSVGIDRKPMFAIDFGVSQMRELLGFRRPSKFIAKGCAPYMRIASHDPQMNWFGDSIELVCKFCSARQRANTSDDEQQPLLINEARANSLDDNDDRLSICFIGIRCIGTKMVRRPIIWLSGALHLDFVMRLEKQDMT